GLFAAPAVGCASRSFTHFFCGLDLFDYVSHRDTPRQLLWSKPHRGHGRRLRRIPGHGDGKQEPAASGDGGLCAELGLSDSRVSRTVEAHLKTVLGKGMSFRATPRLLSSFPSYGGHLGVGGTCK